MIFWTSEKIGRQVNLTWSIVRRTNRNVLLFQVEISSINFSLFLSLKVIMQHVAHVAHVSPTAQPAPLQPAAIPHQVIINTQAGVNPVNLQQLQQVLYGVFASFKHLISTTWYELPTADKATKYSGNFCSTGVKNINRFDCVFCKLLANLRHLCAHNYLPKTRLYSRLLVELPHSGNTKVTFPWHLKNQY